MPDLNTSEKPLQGAIPPMEALARDPESVHSLQSDNQRLRDLVVSLSAALLRNIASDFRAGDGRINRSTDIEYLLSKAEKSFRCARYPGLKTEIAEGLEATGYEFMAKAVEVETAMQRSKWKE